MMISIISDRISIAKYLRVKLFVVDSAWSKSAGSHPSSDRPTVTDPVAPVHSHQTITAWRGIADTAVTDDNG